MQEVLLTAEVQKGEGAKNVDPAAGTLDPYRCGYWNDANLGLGVELLPAGDPRRPDRSRGRGSKIAVLRLLLRVAAAAGGTRADDRQGDRSPWRARCAGVVQLRARGRPRVAGIGRGAGRARRGVGIAPERHVAWPLR